MTATINSLAPHEVRARLDSGRAVLVDIREADEFARSHIPGAHSQPLSGWEQAHLGINPDADVIFTCRSGARTAGACDRLAARISGEAFVLEGGLDAWKRAGLPVAADASAPLEIMRQVQIAAGKPHPDRRLAQHLCCARLVRAVGVRRRRTVVRGD